MGFLEDSVNSVCKKSEEFIRIQRVKLKISGIKSEISSKFEELGRYEYMHVIKEYSDEEYHDSIVEDIRLLKKELAIQQRKLSMTKGGLACARCGALNSDDAKYCSKCGEAF